MTKLKKQVASLNAICPINAGIGGDFISIKYGDKDGNVYMYFLSNEQFGSQFFLKENRNNVLVNLKMIFQNDASREMLKDMVNAKAGLIITYKMSSTGKTATFEIPYEELREMNNHPISQHERNIIIIQNKLAIENNRCPYETEPGVTMAKVALVNNNIVYYLQVDEDMFDFQQWEQSKDEIKQMTTNNFKELRDDPTMISEFRLLISEGVGYHYRYYGSKSKSYFDIIFTLDELNGFIK
ncbi:MAG: hypothetical protein ACI4HQ_09700 [Acetatifactor sp.]